MPRIPDGIWMESGALILDDQGVLWSHLEDGWEHHGPVEDCDVPELLAGHASYLLSEWQLAQRTDMRSQVRDDYYHLRKPLR